MATLDKRDAQRRAERALASGNATEALGHLWSLVDRSHLLDAELESYLGMMSMAFQKLGRPRAAATVELFLGRVDQAERLSGHDVDRARSEILRKRPQVAAQYFERAGWLGHAAMQLEDAGDDRGARLCWERLCDDTRLASDPYTLALVRFNLARTCARLGDKKAARRANVQSMHLLEAGADGFESRGLRDRAFDCYQVLLTLGKDGAFENLAEGYLNCIRILREDNLKYYVFQYYEDFQKLAEKRGELHAAATLFREAAGFAQQQGLPYARFYKRRAGETLVAAAQKTIADGGPAELAENAYAAAIDAYNDLGAFTQVRDVYAALAALELPEKRRDRYARLRERLASVPDENLAAQGFPDYLRMDAAYPEIWRLDVIEWEHAGDAAETMAEVLADPKWPDFTRRRALLCRLYQLGLPDGPLQPAQQAGLAAHLGRVELYAVLAPLERMYASPSAEVRTAAMRAVRQLYFKRSFVLVMQGLSDTEDSVRKEAIEAVATLHFPHAFDPLARIFRESRDTKARRTALGSIGRIQSIDAVEMLIDVLRHGDAVERQSARELLTRSESPETSNLLRRAAAAEEGPERAVLEQIVAARGPG